MATINDVSRLAQVSKATVSRVLSGSRGVKEESRLAVLKAAEALNYAPNLIAQSLSTQTTGCIGVVCAMETIQQAAHYLQALEKQMRLHKKHLLLRFATDAASVQHALSELGRGLCDAMIIIGARFTLPPLDDTIVLIDCLDAEGGSRIEFDHEFAAHTASQYLVSQGRRQLALLNYDQSDAADQTLQGYRSALEFNLIPYNRQLVTQCSPSMKVALQSLLNNGVAFNGLLLRDNNDAQQAKELLQAFNRDVPRQVMIFSLDGSMSLPGQPAIEYPLESLAQRALELIVGSRDAGHSYVVRGALVA